MTTTMPHPDRRLVALGKEMEQVADLADQAGVELECLGVHPLFTETRLYAGPTGAWVLAPAADDPLVRRGEMAIPRPELRALSRLLEAGLDFPCVYVAHEVAPDRLARAGLPTQRSVLPPGRFTPLDPATSGRLVDSVPVPPRTARVARHLGSGAGALLKVFGLAVPVAGTLAGATVAAGGAAVRALALDPIVFGAWTLDRRADPGTPAAWFVLARWLW